MTYLEWKKRILIYWIARARKVEAIPESLDFLLYTHFKGVDPHSLPHAMTLILPATKFSLKSAVDCIAAAFKLDTQIPIQVQEINPVDARSLPVAKEMASLNVDAAAVGQVPFSEPLLKGVIRITRTETSMQAVAPELQLIKFSTLGLRSGLLAVACLLPRGAVEYTSLGYKALLATELIARQYVPFLAVADIDIEQGIGIEVALDKAFLGELTASVKVEYKSVISAALEKVEPLTTAAALSDSTTSQITATLSRAPITELMAGIDLALNSKLAIRVNGRDFGKLVVDVLLRLDQDIDFKPAEIAIDGLLLEISDYTDYDIATEFNSLAPSDADMEFSAPKEEYIVNASCAGLNPAALATGLNVTATAKATCLKRLFIADYAGITINALKDSSIESLAFSEINYKNK